jgi:hypothetical protein
MSQLYKSGKDIILKKPSTMSPIEDIPPAAYTFAVTDDHELMFTLTAASFPEPANVYGDTIKYKNLIIDSFREATEGTGVLLTGLKGMGKTLLCELTANWFINNNMPVFIVREQPVPINWLRAAAQLNPDGCLIILEEFSKLYPEDPDEDRPSQVEMLSLLSDKSLSNLLVMASDNSTGDILSFLINRPQRFLWHFEFNGIKAAEAIDICTRAGVVPEIIKDITAWCFFNQISYDVLNVLIHQALKYKDPNILWDVVRLLNIPSLPAFRITCKTDHPEYIRRFKYGQISYTKHNGEIEAVFDLTDMVQTSYDSSGRNNTYILKLPNGSLDTLVLMRTDNPFLDDYLIEKMDN